jgi:predicted branched-subunit amino acid permease
VGIIVLTTFIVNLRHALYSITLAPQLGHLPQRWLLPLGFWLTDESFVVTAARCDQPDTSPYKHWYMLGSALFMYVNWQVCTLIGVLAGQAIPDPAGWGLDFAMSVTFTGMVAPMVKTRPVALAALVSSLTAVLANSLPNKAGLMLAAGLGIAAGLLAEPRGEPTPEGETP